ncbi:MAG: DUF4143 domain-containing protein [Deltaproteobacteria bacterium]|nr:DUF4143 domain-containing protein [Deltaproteobacteria bacterium]
MCEITKQLSWTNHRARPYHFRSHTGQEVDLILEDPGGRMIGMEIKFADTVSSKHFKGLRSLKGSAKDRFFKGFVLYTGANTVPFGDDLFALPVSAIWAA